MLNSYQKHCLKDPIVPSMVFGGFWSGIDMAMGHRITPSSVGKCMGFIYLYNALQCPMVEITGRPSAYHNLAAGGILGYIGVSTGQVGIPFVSYDLFYRYPFLRPAWVGAAVYGGFGFSMALLGRKPI